MKYIPVIMLYFLSVVSFASEKDAVAVFVKEFYAGFNGNTPEADLEKYFAKKPVFLLGQQPAISDNPQIAQRMVAMVREVMGVEKTPYSDLQLVNIYVSTDGSAAVSALFKRQTVPKNVANNLCNIFSLAKLEGKWKIMGWFVFPQRGAQGCS